MFHQYTTRYTASATDIGTQPATKHNSGVYLWYSELVVAAVLSMELELERKERRKIKEGRTDEAHQ